MALASISWAHVVNFLLAGILIGDLAAVPSHGAEEDVTDLSVCSAIVGASYAGAPCPGALVGNLSKSQLSQVDFMVKFNSTNPIFILDWHIITT